MKGDIKITNIEAGTKVEDTFEAQEACCFRVCDECDVTSEIIKLVQDMILILIQLVDTLDILVVIYDYYCFSYISIQSAGICISIFFRQDLTR